MRIGPAKVFEHDHSQLEDLSIDMECGLMGLVFPKECHEFVASQFKRFNIPLPTNAIDVIDTGVRIAQFWVDHWDPYALLFGASDVAISDLAYRKAIMLTEEGTVKTEVDPEELETYEWCGNAEETFNYIMANPGLENLDIDWRSLKEMMFTDEFYDMGAVCEFTPSDCIRELEKLCKNLPKEDDYPKYQHYFNLATWAAFAWILGPLSRDFRVSNHPIFEACANYKIAIMYQGSVLGIDSYSVDTRAPQSCMSCGLDSYCVGLVYTGTTTSYLCEHCLVGFAHKGSSCGTRRCTYIECKHHPYHGLDRQAGMRYMLGSGKYLRQLASNEVVKKLA